MHLTVEDPEKIVTDAIARGFGGYDDLPTDLQALIEQHCDNLVTLTKDMQAAGREPSAIRALVAALVTAYELELISVIEART